VTERVKLSHVLVETLQCMVFTFSNWVEPKSNKGVCSQLGEALGCGSASARQRLEKLEKLHLVEIARVRGRIEHAAPTAKAKELVAAHAEDGEDVFVPSIPRQIVKGRIKPAAASFTMRPLQGSIPSLR
jgi:hypothetical protein